MFSERGACGGCKCCLGIPIYIHFTLPLCIGILMLPAFFTLDVGRILADVAVYVVVLFPSILIHEFGHALAARRFGRQVHRILLWIFGGVCFCEMGTSRYGQEILIALAGPLTHLPFIAMYLGISAAIGSGSNPFVDDVVVHYTQPPYAPLPPYDAYAPPMALAPLRGPGDHGSVPVPADLSHLRSDVIMFWVDYASQRAALMNIGLFAFNLLLPVFPLDGGVVLVNALLYCGVSIYTTAKVTLAVGFLVLGGCLGLVVWIVITAGFWSAIFLGLMVLWLGMSLVSLLTALRRDQLALHPLFAHRVGTAVNAAEAGVHPAPNAEEGGPPPPQEGSVSPQVPPALSGYGAAPTANAPPPPLVAASPDGIPTAHPVSPILIARPLSQDPRLGLGMGRAAYATDGAAAAPGDEYGPTYGAGGGAHSGYVQQGLPMGAARRALQPLPGPEPPSHWRTVPTPK
eukprot:TRINITY_DN46632_c0_g1_i1.p1 TRINITY_DN46632_c0_g1~~TRINITY_DN46632_c0_g1_i1.p1  ORF type:complete len:458 (+),score=48.66 TRINITY_DN46632_c0_g1_i1:173-1546(+)